MKEVVTTFFLFLIANAHSTHWTQLTNLPSTTAATSTTEMSTSTQTPTTTQLPSTTTSACPLERTLTGDVNVSQWVDAFNGHTCTLNNATLLIRDVAEVEMINFTSVISFINSTITIELNAHLTKIEFGAFDKNNSKSTGSSLKVRGNVNLSPQSRQELVDLCTSKTHFAECDIQNHGECVFREPVRNSSQYINCRNVFGNLTFDEDFEMFPEPLNAEITGCLIIKHTRIKNFAFLNPTRADCSAISHNIFACKDRVIQPDRFNFESQPMVACNEGHCQGGIVSRELADNFVGCEKVFGDLIIDSSSGDFDPLALSSIRAIFGRLDVSNHNLTELTLPFLREVTTETACPSILIDNMPELRSIIVSPKFGVFCSEMQRGVAERPLVRISASPKLRLSKFFLRRLKARNVLITGLRGHEADLYMTILFWLVAVFVVFLFAEFIVWMMRVPPTPAEKAALGRKTV